MPDMAKEAKEFVRAMMPSASRAGVDIDSEAFEDMLREWKADSEATETQLSRLRELVIGILQTIGHEGFSVLD